MLRIFEGQIMYLIDNGNYTIYFLTEDMQDYISTFTLHISDDFAICAFSPKDTHENNGRLEIVIDKRNLFYQPLQNFLGSNEVIVIEDDMTPQRHGKKVSIKRIEEKVVATFEYLEIEYMNAYGINIKNILYDGRSKLDRDGTDIKARLHTLFSELDHTFQDYGKDDPQKKLNIKPFK